MGTSAAMTDNGEPRIDPGYLDALLSSVEATVVSHGTRGEGSAKKDSSLFLPATTATVQPAAVVPPPLACDQRILDRFRADVRACGVVGEEATAATLYLLLTSRVLPKPVSAAVKGHSSSGKSFTVETTVRFFPARRTSR